MPTLRILLLAGLVAMLAVVAACAAPGAAPPATGPTSGAQPTSVPPTSPAPQPTTMPTQVEQPSVAPTQGAPGGAGLANTFVMALSVDTISADPHERLGTSTVRMARLVYDGLLRFKGATAELEPALAESYEASPDGKTYTFKLRQGVKFHDGSDFNAEAAKLSFDRIKGIGLCTSALLTQVDSVEVVDPQTLRVNLKAPDVSFLQKLPKIYMVSPKGMAEKKTAEDPWARTYFKDNAVGTGPYKLTEWIKEQQWVLDRNADYWGGWQNQPERVIQRVVRESSQQRQLLERGQVDVAVDLGSDDAKALQGNPDINTVIGNTVNVWMIPLNTQKGPLKDKRVREAIRLAYDYEGHVQFALNGFGQQLLGPVPRGLPYADTSLQLPKQDLERAKQLLKDAGFENGFKVKFIHLPEAPGEEISGCQIMQAELKKLNITVECVGLTFAAKVAEYKTPEDSPDMAGVYAFPGYPDPNETLFNFYHSNRVRPNGGFNLAWYSNPQLDELLVQQQTERDATKREALIKQIQQILVDDSVAVWVSQPAALTAARKWVKGYEYEPFFHQTVDVYALSLEGK